MTDPEPREGSDTSDVTSGSFGPTLELNIKTLDSRIHNFHVDTNMVVSAFKEKVAGQTGVPVGQQRLIFRGKVLKDDLPLSEYHVENGDTFHLVERQPQPPTGSGSTSGEATSGHGNRGQDSNGGQSRNRIGHIAHSVVLGTLNVGDLGEAVAPDIGQVIGSVLNSIGIGNLGGVMQPGVQATHGNEAEGSRHTTGSQNLGGNQPVPSQPLHGQSASHTMQIPLGAAVALPTLNMPIPDSLDTLVEFMNRMELALSQSGDQPNQSSASNEPQHTTQLPRSSRGLPTVEAVSTVLQQVQRLLSSRVVTALSSITDRLDQEGGSTDPAVRGQLQTESIQFGVAMQHLGAFFLELGRTILTLRMGQSPAELFVNAGPAVYISSSGPNPIMVQPFPLQTSSLFGGASGTAPNPVVMGPIGAGGIPRNVNIHIHTGASLAPMIPRMGNGVRNGEGTQGQGGSGTQSADSTQARGLSGLNATTAPVRPGVIPVSGVLPPGTDVSQAPDSNLHPAILGQMLLRRNLIPNLQNDGSTDQQVQPVGGVRDNDTISHQTDLSTSRVGETSQSSHHAVVTDDTKAQSACHQSDVEGGKDINSGRGISVSSESTCDRSKASQLAENLDSPAKPHQGSNPDSTGVPLGLGLGGLQPKKRVKQLITQSKSGDGASTSSQNQQAREVGQQVLQSLTSLSAWGDASSSSAPSAARQGADGQIDIADAVSQFLENPAMNGLLAGVSQQAGVGSPDVFRNMLQQFTQNPAMRNTVNQIAQQIDTNGLGDAISDMGRGQGGGFDLSRMMQQMMPIVSQALGGVSSAPQVDPMETILSRSRSRIESEVADDPQIDPRLVQRFVNQSSPQEIFRALAQNVGQHLGNGSIRESVVNQLSSDDGLIQRELTSSNPINVLFRKNLEEGLINLDLYYIDHQDFVDMLEDDLTHRFLEG